MYRAFYGLEKKPFQISADPEFLWLGPKHREGLAILLYGVSDNKGFLVMSGGVGTGKTTLIHALLKQLDDSVVVASVPDPGLELIEFYRFIASSFGMKGKYKSKVDFLFDFEDFLKKTHAQGRIVLLIIDEAQRLSSKMLEEIRLLSNIEIPEQKLLNIFFVGQEEFYNLLADPGNRALKQRITINYHLKSLTFDETCMLIDYRLKVAGASRPIFEKEALERIHFHSQGHPRRINIICDHALLSGFVDNRTTIGADIIEECSAELMLPGEKCPIEAGTASNDHSPPAAVEPPANVANPTAPAVLGEAILDAPPPPRPWFFRERVFTLGTALLVMLLAVVVYFGPQRLMTPFSPLKELIAVAPQTEEVARSEKASPTPESRAPSRAEGDVPFSDGGQALEDRSADPSVPLDSIPAHPTQKAPIDQEGSGEQPAETARTASYEKPPDDDVDGNGQVLSVPGEEDPPMAVDLAKAQPPADRTEPAAVPLDVAVTAETGNYTTDVTPALPVETDYAADVSDGTAIDSAPDEKVAVTEAALPEDQTPSGITTPAETADAAINAFEAATEKQAVIASDVQASAAAPPPLPERRARDSTPSPPEQERLPQGLSPSRSPGGNQMTSDEPDPVISPPPAPASPQETPSTEPSLASEPTDSTAVSESMAAAPEAPSTSQAADHQIADPELLPREPLPRKTDGDIGTDQQAPAYAAVTAAAPQTVDETPVYTTVERLELFLQTYCRAYSNKDIDRFTALFTFDAVERDRPFVDLIPVYRSNFEKLDEIDYEIDLQSYEETIDGSEILVKGGFRLRYRMGNQDWKSSNGRIEMTLVALDDEFRVKNLDYRTAP